VIGSRYARRHVSAITAADANGIMRERDGHGSPADMIVGPVRRGDYNRW
jgi:hypothetical protein